MIQDEGVYSRFSLLRSKLSNMHLNLPTHINYVLMPSPTIYETVSLNIYLQYLSVLPINYYINIRTFISKHLKILLQCAEMRWRLSRLSFASTLAWQCSCIIPWLLYAWYSQKNPLHSMKLKSFNNMVTLFHSPPHPMFGKLGSTLSQNFTKWHGLHQTTFIHEKTTPSFKAHKSSSTSPSSIVFLSKHITENLPYQ